MSEQRFSQTAKEFAAEVIAEGGAAVRAVLEAIDAGTAEIEKGVRTIGGVEVPRFNVDLSEIPAAVSGDLKAEAKRFAKAADRECAMRGEDWAAEGMHLAIAELLVKPLRAALDETKPDAPASKAAAKGKGKK